MLNLGQFIKERRIEMGISQKKLGEACQLSDSEIMKIEKGDRKKPNWNNLCKIAKALSFHPFELLLVAGYISEQDINPNIKLRGLERLDNSDMDQVQLFIDFLLSRKSLNRKEEEKGE